MDLEKSSQLSLKACCEVPTNWELGIGELEVAAFQRGWKPWRFSFHRATEGADETSDQSELPPLD